MSGAPTFPSDHALVAAVVAWAEERIGRPHDPAAHARPASELHAALGRTVTPGGIGWERALQLFTDVVVTATRAMDHPGNLAYVPSAPTPAAVTMDLALSAAVIFGGMWEAGAGAIAAENDALRWLCDLLGWGPDAGGCFTAGSTIGNLSALVAARRRHEEAHGRPRRRWRLVATDDAHSSVHSAASTLDAEVVPVPVDERGRLTGAALLSVLAADDGDGLFAVIASAGTTNAGAIDDLGGVADVCGERGLWLHVDGAYGGAALCVPEARGAFAGIERADSFVVDPHKWLFAPFDCGALVYRDARHGRAAHAQHASYLDEIDREAWNPSDYAVHLSRRARGLPFWFSLAAYGTERYADAVGRGLHLARFTAAAVEERPYLRLLVEPQLSVVLFERVGWGADELSSWSRAHARAADFLCVPTRWRGRPCLRLCFVHPDTDQSLVVGLLDSLG
jgi:glutamate/tyrosine decarboxylase-like PLP-dependent enzyme